MSPIADRYVELSKAMAVGCERLVHPSVEEAGARQGQRRFIGTMLAAPFLVVSGAVTLVTAGIGVATTVAAIFAVFGLYWFLGLLVAATGSMRWAAPVALAATTLAGATLMGVAGGLASPLALLVLVLPVEALWTGASRKAALWGLAGGACVILLQAFPFDVFPSATQPAPWHWLLPLAWMSTIYLRIPGFRAMIAETEAGQPAAELEDVIDAVVLRIARQGEVLDASRQARTILNLEPELLANAGLFERMHLSDRVSYLSALADLREGAVLRKLDVRIRLPQGEAVLGYYRRLSLELMRAQDGRDVFIAVLRDADGIADLQRQLEEAGEAAASAEVAKGRFLAAVSHELRTPLNAILGFSDMLLHEMFGPFHDPRQKEYVGLVRDSGQHLLSVVTSILDVSKIECGAYTTEPEPFRFIEAVEMCRAMMQLQADAKTIRLATQTGGDLGEINADRRAIQQILINLVSNAIKFTPDGGEVVIGANRIGSRLHFWVSDTGIGIDEENIGKLGKPFMQIQNGYTRAFEGTGLGLSLVKGLVALHDGTMSVESAPGEGTMVTISLPVDGPRERTDGPAVVMLPAENAKEGGYGSLRKTA